MGVAASGEEGVESVMGRKGYQHGEGEIERGKR